MMSHSEYFNTQSGKTWHTIHLNLTLPIHIAAKVK